jgi:hypothetical protein
MPLPSASCAATAVRRLAPIVWDEMVWSGSATRATHSNTLAQIRLDQAVSDSAMTIRSKPALTARAFAGMAKPSGAEAS